MSDNSANNKRIVKNTAFLYIRMLISMIVGLYTSRVVLNTLGIENYGIYNVVGGVISMFTFVNSAMASTTSRFLTIALGKKELKKLQRVFQTALIIHALIAVFVVVVGETVGLWFLLNKMQIPELRMDAAMWVYQISIVTTAISIMNVPFNASIIAHEKMSAFAYISILDVVLKLLIVYFLLFISFDKLKVYAVLLFFAQAINQFIYMYYCKQKFAETKIRFILDRSLFKEMAAFAGWSLYGNFAYVAYNQGLNILLNIFFGPIINAARGIAVQVQSIIYSFVNNFQIAMSPQLTKSYATGDIDYMNQLIFQGSKFSFYLLLFMALPVLLETPYILQLWLTQVPEHAVSFLRIMILINLVDTLSTPVGFATRATGKIKMPQLIAGTILVAILPISYFVLKLGASAEAVFVVHLCCAVIAQVARVIMLKNRVRFSIRQYLSNAIFPVSIVFVIVMGLSILMMQFIKDTNLINLLFVCIATVFINTVVIFVVGITKSERCFLVQKLLITMSKLK